MVGSVSSSREHALLIRRNNSDLFSGPTLIQVASRLEENVFKQINLSADQAEDSYPRYIECKAFAKFVYDKRYKGESYVAKMRMLEPHDKHSIFVYSVDRDGWVNGTLRLCLDSDIGLPMADSVANVIDQYRKQGLVVAEPGRFASSTAKSHCLISAAYEIAHYVGIDVYMMQCRADHRAFYQSQCGAEVLAGYSAPEHCINMIWPIANTPDSFIERFGNNRESLLALMSTLENRNV
jgi:hypothetical protein